MGETMKGLPRWARWTIWCVVAIVAVLAIGPWLVPTDGIRQRVIDKVYGATGRTLSIDGPISFRFLPWPEVSVEKVALSNPPDGVSEPMLEAYRIVAVPSLTSLLSGHAVLDELRIELPEANLSLDDEGRPNWRFKKPPKAGKNAEAAGFAPILIKASYAAGLARQGVSLISDASPVAVAAVTEPSSPMSVTEKQANKDGPIQRFVHRMAKVRLPSNLPVKQVVITNGRINFQRRPTSEKRVLVDGMMLQVSAPSMATPILVSGSGQWRSIRWHLKGELSDLPGLFASTGSPLHLSVKGLGGEATIDGLTALGGVRPHGRMVIKGKISPQISEAALSAKMRRLAIALSSGSEGGQASMHANFDGERLDVDDCVIAFGDAIEGTCFLTVGLDSAVPKISGGIDIDRINLDRLLGPPAVEETPPASLTAYLNRPGKEDKVQLRREPKKWKTKRIPFYQINQVDADIRLKVASVRVRQTNFGPVDLHLRSNGGRAELNLEGTVVRAPVVVRAVVDAPAQDQPSRAALTVSTKSLVLDPFVTSGRAVFKSGTVGIDLHFDTVGDNQRDLIGNLSGGLALSLTDADLRFYRVVPAWVKALAPDPAVCPLILEGATGSAAVKVSDGSIDVESLVVSAPKFGLTADGRINLLTQRTNLKIGGGGQPCIAPGTLLGVIGAPVVER